jgi:hypothetical protein
MVAITPVVKPRGSSRTTERILKQLGQKIKQLGQKTQGAAASQPHIQISDSHQFETGFLFKCVVAFIFSGEVFGKESFNNFYATKQNERSESRQSFATNLVTTIKSQCESLSIMETSHIEIEDTTLTDKTTPQSSQSFSFGDQTFTISNKEYSNGNLKEVILTVSGWFSKKTYTLTNDAITNLKQNIVKAS